MYKFFFLACIFFISCKIHEQSKVNSLDDEKIFSSIQFSNVFISGRENLTTDDKKFLNNFEGKVVENQYLIEQIGLKQKIDAVRVSHGNPIGDLKYLASSQNLEIGQLCPTGKYAMGSSLHEYGHSLFTIIPIKGVDTNWVIIDTYINALFFSTNPLAEKADLDEIVRPYNELFADIFAVFILSNLSILTEEFQECLADHLDSEAIEFRNFNSDFQVNGWERGNLANSGLMSSESVHYVFTPFRSYIGNKIIENNVFQDNKKKEKLFKTVYDSIISEINTNLNKKMTYGEWFEFSKESLNKNLIQTFEAKYID